jgi:dihydroflavonol-4-reductase
VILVTGATGFLGSELVHQLVAAGARVRILRRESSSLDLLGDVSEAVEHFIGDVTDPDSLVSAFDGVESVYHTAAALGFGGKKEEAWLHEVNVRGTAHVVDAARNAGVRRLLYTSSMAAFGRPKNSELVIDESAEWTDSPYNSAYARSKYLGEREVHRGIAEGLDAVIVNPSLIFGPGRREENTWQIVQRARRGARFAPQGGTNVVDVANVAACMRAAMDRGRTGERYFLGAENLPWMEILTILAQAFDRPGPRFVVPARVAVIAGAASELVARITGKQMTLTRSTARVSSRFYRYSNEKARAELGCEFRPFEETAKRIAESMRNA